jgi:hypothetical protein
MACVAGGFLMPWGKLDDSLYDHPKLDKLGRQRMACAGLWAVSISWCNRRLTDGFVPLSRVAQLGGTVAQADHLVKAGLFEKVPEGYQVHDFLDFNDSKEYVLLRRAKDAERQRVQRESKQESQRDTAGTNGVTPPVSPSPARGRVPGPSSPVPSLPGQTTHAARDEEPFSEGETELLAFIAQHGAFIRPESGFGVRLLGLMERRGAEAVLEMARTLATADDAMSDRQWVFGLEKALDAIPSPPMEELLPEEDPKSKRVWERMQARRLEYLRNTGLWPEEWGEKPNQVSVA